jgi:hypothetical protein
VNFKAIVSKNISTQVNKFHPKQYIPMWKGFLK